MKNVFIVILETTPLSGMASITRGVVKRNEFNKMTIHQNLYRIFEKETKAKQFDIKRIVQKNYRWICYVFFDIGRRREGFQTHQELIVPFV